MVRIAGFKRHNGKPFADDGSIARLSLRLADGRGEVPLGGIVPSPFVVRVIPGLYSLRYEWAGRPRDPAKRAGDSLAGALPGARRPNARSQRAERAAGLRVPQQRRPVPGLGIREREDGADRGRRRRSAARIDPPASAADPDRPWALRCALPLRGGRLHRPAQPGRPRRARAGERLLARDRRALGGGLRRLSPERSGSSAIGVRKRADQPRRSGQPRPGRARTDAVGRLRVARPPETVRRRVRARDRRVGPAPQPACDPDTRLGRDARSEPNDRHPGGSIPRPAALQRRAIPRERRRTRATSTPCRSLATQAR